MSAIFCFLQKIKKLIIQVQYIPERIKYKIYHAASKGKIYMPDKLFQKWDYKLFSGQKLSFKNPKTYTEKLQWLKYYYHNPIQTKLVDKYEVRDFIKETIGEEYLVNLYGVYNSVDEVDFDKLPNEFVLKCTHDSGSIAICHDKADFDFAEAKKMLERGMRRNQFYLSREWPYKNIKPRIICEELLKDDVFEDIQDYKFFCFDGKVEFFVIHTDRHSSMKMTYYYPDWEKIPMKHKKYPVNPGEDFHPKNFDKMIELAEKLSKAFPHVRVDFYYVNDKIYFGEMTFYSSGGRIPFEPDEYNYKFGDMIKLPPKMR